jgi:hypothetical protein
MGPLYQEIDIIDCTYRGKGPILEDVGATH